MKKRLINLIILVLGLLLVVNLSQSIWHLLKAPEQIRETEEELEALRKEQEALLGERDYYQSDLFLEQEARNRLNMSRPGETVVVLPENVEELVNGGGGKVNNEEEIPNWKKWWRLFF